jgi:hypothetical protein
MADEKEDVITKEDAEKADSIESDVLVGELENYDILTDAKISETAEVEEKEEKKEEKKELSPEEKAVQDRIEKATGHLGNLDKAIREANATLHKLRTEKKGEKGEETPQLTDTQLLKLMEDAGDDKTTLLQIIKYAADQAAKKGKTEALNEADLISKRKATDSAMRGMFKEKWDDPASDLRLSVDKLKSELGFEDHPMGDAAAAGILALNDMPAIRKAAYDFGYAKGKEEATGKKVEENREDSIKGNQGGSTKKTVTKGDTKDDAKIKALAKTMGYNTPEKLKRFMEIYKSNQAA